MPQYKKPTALKLSVTLSGNDAEAEYAWDLYAFPKVKRHSAVQLRKKNLAVLNHCDAEQLQNLLRSGSKIVLFGAGPFTQNEVNWQLSVEGRTNGHLATVISEHPLRDEFIHPCGINIPAWNLMRNSGSMLITEQKWISSCAVRTILSVRKRRMRSRHSVLTKNSVFPVSA